MARKRIYKHANRLPALDDPQTEITQSVIWGERKVYPPIDPPLMELSSEEFCNICKLLNWEFPIHKIEHIKQLGRREGELFRYENEFLDTWGRTKENVAIYRNYSAFDYDMEFEDYKEIIESMERVPEEKERHIDELRRIYQELRACEPDFLQKWGYTKANLAIIRHESDYYRDEWSDYYDFYDREPDYSRDLDDMDIIRIIQNGDGDMYGYGK